ncbi:MAG: zinc ribbon domain-containing protein [Anaerolineae bacterium]|nr:MAG: zinc ribbon domain-containing protein [Anaerolineae bacterium]
MLNPTTLNSLVLALSAWGGAFLVALWLSLIFWAFRDIRTRTVDNLLRILAVLVVAGLFLPGVVIYYILRPARTLEQEYQQSLEEEALLRAIEEHTQCPGCSRHVEKAWMVCPDCQTRLKKTCHHCAKLMELHWNICPHCGSPAPGMRREGLSMDEALRPSPSDPFNQE